MIDGIKNIVWRIVGVSVVVLLLIVAVVWGHRQVSDTVPCPSIEYIIEDSTERSFVNADSLTLWLMKDSLYPVERPIHEISIHGIEEAIGQHPMVRTSECYVTLNNEVKVRVTQRVPILRVQTPYETYLIDGDRCIMPNREEVRDSVLLVKGDISQDLAVTLLADIAEWVGNSVYWTDRINYIHVQAPDRNYVYLKGENQPRIVLGELEAFEQKMTKLRTFFENGKEATKDKIYKELDVRFKGQVVGRR